MSRRGDACRDDGFFVMRTPLLPLARYLELGSEPEDLRPLLDDPIVREALEIASPDLCARLPVWERDPRGERGRSIERALRRYLARMCARPTPFGLFAACSLGVRGRETRCELAGASELRRRTRLDMDHLDRLVRTFVADPRLRAELHFHPNSSLYELAGRLRYAEARETDGARSYHLVAVEPDRYLRCVLDAATAGARPGVLTTALTELEPEVAPEAARAYVDELIDAQLLVSELELPVTGPEPLERLLEVLAARTGFAAPHAALSEVAARIADLDARGPGGAPGAYDRIASALARLPAPVREGRMVQVDSLRPARELTLGSAPLAELRRSVELLHGIAAPPVSHPLDRFRDAFLARYGEAEIPLTACLDEETGLGFMASTSPLADGAPALAGLPLGGHDAPDGLPWRPRDDFLLRILAEALADDRDEIVLTPERLRRQAAPDPPPLPDAFSVTARLAASSAADLAAGRFRVLVTGASGPSGANLLGRFCHLDEELAQRVEAHLRREEAYRPDAVYAEIVHLPEGRVGNVLRRPALRAHEIPFLGEAHVDEDRRLPLADLLVTVRGGRVVLRSRRLDREVVPRLTSAHNFLGANLGIYKFLASLQTQGTTTRLGWDWGPLARSPRLPRVRCGRIVLSCARWTLDGDDGDALVSARDAGADAVAGWRRSRRIPRLVELVEGDNCLVLDLARAVDVDLLVDMTFRGGAFILRELFPGPDELVAAAPQGHLVHEVVVPMTRNEARPRPARAATGTAAGTAGRPLRDADPVARRFAPGSEWLYAKLDGGPVVVDHLLTEVVAPLVASLRREGLIDRWFFLRYGDPDWHLRLRFRGRPDVLAGAVLPRLHSAVAPWLGDGRLRSLRLDTYEREVERYGGPAGIGAAERLFEVDSDAVLALLRLSGSAGRRWRCALLGADAMLADFGFDLAERSELNARRRAAFFAEFGGAKALHRELGRRYRTARAWIEPALVGDVGEVDAGAELAAARTILVARRRTGAEAVAKLRRAAAAGRLSREPARIAGTLIHMHVNRLLRQAARAHELLIHDHLDRAYRSLQARSARRARAG